jgi:filamentous hemagglutinin family protein
MRSGKGGLPSPLPPLLAWALAVAVVVLHATAAQAQVTTAITPTPGAGALGTAVNQAGNSFDITGGTRAGGNLFHSFGLFSVGTGDIANFSNTTGAGVANILGRVTGGQVSAIQGTIQTTNFPGANLFLLNPAGWVFGPGAALNVSGSFHVSTADYMRFADPAKSVFCVGACPNGQPSVLSVAAPAAFGFLGPSTGSISIQQSTLQVPDQATLSVVGGSVQIADSTLQALGGRVQIGSFASAGEATVNGLEGAFATLGPIQLSNSFILTPGTAGFDSLGNFVGLDGGSVLIRGGQVDLSASFIDASGGVAFDDFGNVFGTTAGTVVIRGGQLTLTGGSSVTNFNQGSSSPGVAIRLEASGDVVMDGGSSLQSTAMQSGDAGAVQVEANSLKMREFASINSDTQAGGRGADISIDVGQLTLEGGARIGSSASAFVPPAGAGGDINVKATGPITITGVSSGIVSLGLSSEPTANGGAVTVSAQSLTLGDLASIGSTALGPAPGGKVAISVGDLSVTGGATISSTTFQGQGGDVSVTATGSALISGAGFDLNSGTEIASAIRSGGDASLGTPGSSLRAGNIAVKAGSLTVADFAVIQNGNDRDVAGNVSVTADSVLISNGGKILSQAFTNAVGDVTITTPTLTIDNGLIQTSTIQEGNAGNITANVGTLTLTGGGQIVASSAFSATGAGGSIKITANDVFASGQSPSGVPVSTFSQDLRSGIFSTTDGVGAAGQIAVAAHTVNLADTGRIDSSTTGAGHGGTIAVNASGTLSLSGGAGLFSTAEGTGAAGSIVASSPMVAMTQGGTMSVATTNAGAAGSIQLSGGTVALDGGAQLNSSTAADGLGGSIAVNAGNVSISGPGTGLFSTATSTGDAGQIAVAGSSLSLSNQGQISASSSAAGRAGTIAIDAGSLSLDGAASLLSNASGTGPGGDINITAGDVSLQGGSTISANSTGSAQALAGSVNVVFGNTLSLGGGSAITTTSLLADGGNISVTSTGSTLSLFDSQITTSVQSGVGQGGNITLGSDLHALDFLIMSDGQIRADAFGGPGGNIRVFADTFLSSGSIISASSALSAPGTIAIQAQFTDLNSALVQLPADVLQATILLRASCAARLAEGKTSSLVVAGREGVPPEPDGLLASPLVLDAWTASERTTTEEPPAPLLTLRWPTPLACP